MDLKGEYIPTLDGVRLTDTPEGFALPDGSLVPDARRDEVVYVRASAAAPADASETGWWRALGQAALDQGVVADELAPLSGGAEVAEILAALGAPPSIDEIEVEAGFFHRTLSQWITAAPAADGARVEAPLWDYDCWKADIEREDDEGERAIYTAHLFRGDKREPEVYRYWILVDDGRITASGWLSDPPDLIGGEDEFASVHAAASALSAEAAANLMADD